MIKYVCIYVYNCVYIYIYIWGFLIKILQLIHESLLELGYFSKARKTWQTRPSRLALGLLSQWKRPGGGGNSWQPDSEKRKLVHGLSYTVRFSGIQFVLTICSNMFKCF